MTKMISEDGDWNEERWWRRWGKVRCRRGIGWFDDEAEEVDEGDESESGDNELSD